MTTGTPSALRVVILGNDAFLAARPAQPLQLVRACQRAGYDLVVPVSWGEELLATRLGEMARAHEGAVLVAAHCPRVVDALRVAPPERATCVPAVSPPRATARYIRAALAGRTVEVAYVGDCPGARDGRGEIDETISPLRFMGRLLESGIVVEEQSHHLEGQLPPERARFASAPGGIPDSAWLSRRAGAAVREAAPATVGALAAAADLRALVLDLADACGCDCARDRFAVTRLEPPRATAPVLDVAHAVNLADPVLELALARLARSTASSGQRLADSASDGPRPPARAVTTGAGASTGGSRADATPSRAVPAPSSTSPYDLTISLEPWFPAAPRAAARGGHAVKLRGATPGPTPRLEEISRLVPGEATRDVPPQPPRDDRPIAGSGGRGSHGPAGVRPRSLSPVPPVISPALRTVMDHLAEQDREARRRSVRRWGTVTAIALITFVVTGLILGTGAGRGVPAKESLAQRADSAAVPASPMDDGSAPASATPPGGAPSAQLSSEAPRPPKPRANSATELPDLP